MFFCCATRDDGCDKYENEAERTKAAQKIQARQRGKCGRKKAEERRAEIEAYKAAAASAAPAEAMEETTEPTGPTRLLHIEVVSAKGLRDVVGGRLSGKRSSPFVRVDVGGVNVETATIKNSLNPTWNESFEIVDYEQGTNVNLSVWHPAVKKKPEICLGRTTVEASSFEAGALENSDLKLDDTGLKKGDAFLKVKVSWSERISSPNNGRISAYKDEPVTMWIVRFRAIGLRCGPGVHEERTKTDLVPGEEFAVVESVQGANDQCFLRLQDGRGWAFTKSVKDGETLCERLDAAEPEPVEEEGIAEAGGDDTSP